MTGTTVDGILNQRVRLKQPRQGFRVAIDTVFLAASVPAIPKDNILDLGCGVGGAMLALAMRVSPLLICGVEIQPELADLCRENIATNPLESRLIVAEGDVTEPLASYLAGQFDQVMMNPPYHDRERHDPSPIQSRNVANTEVDDGLKLWLTTAQQALKFDGCLTLIHRADRLPDILDELELLFGEIWVLPLLPKAGQPAKRVLIRAFKNEHHVVHDAEPLILHNADGSYTAAANAILRDCMPLMFIPQAQNLMTATLPVAR